MLHTHRSRAAGRTRKGLALRHSNNIITRPLELPFATTAFELQLVSIQVSHVTVKVANLYRPPTFSKVTFLDEFAEMLILIEHRISEKLFIFGDFNMPGEHINSIDDRLSTLLDVHDYQQHVTIMPLAAITV